MKTPICEVCLKSDMLCNSCQEKLDTGKISEKGVEVSRFIYKLKKDMKSIEDIEIKKVMDCKGVLVIITGRGDAARLVGRDGSIVKKIAKKFKKSIRILEEASSFREFIENLIYPTQITGINTLYRNNEEILRVRIPSLQKRRLLVPPDSFSQAVSNFFGLKAEIIFDK